MRIVAQICWFIIITIMQQSKNEVQYNDCIFCEEQSGDGLFFMMNEALKVKYMQNPKDHSTNYIDSILRLESPSNQIEAIAGCKYRQYQALDDHDQFLKRQYQLVQFGGKITHLSQYYKFHNDIPKVVELGVEKIMGKYYDKKRQFDYKRIKKVLKAEQGLSITSVQQSQSSISDSQAVKKSRYSTLLNSLSHSNLNEMSESKILYQMCKQIDKAIPSSHKSNDFNFKGSFPEDRMFQYYIQSEEQKLKNKLRERNKMRQDNNRILKKFNYQEFLKSRQKATDQSKQTKAAKQEKKTQKDKFVYNTNIKIEIRNAMFYSEGQPALHIANIESDKNSNNVENRFKKKTLVSQGSTLNSLKQYRSNQKIAAEIYKSSQHDLRLRNHALINNQRQTTKENVNQSRSKEKRKSYSKQLHPDYKKSTNAQSARKLIFSNKNQWILARQPARSLSTSAIKKRSTSVNQGGLSANSLKKVEKASIERKPIETISRYGSSEYKVGLSQKEGKSVSIKQLLSRKLKFKLQ